MTNRRPVVVVALLLSLFMAALEATVVSTVMPTVVGDLHGVHHYSWVFTGYLLTSTVTGPLFGKLADLYGRKPVMLAGILIFIAGSAASGMATSMGALIAFRALQGIGAGSMQPMSLTIIGDLFSIEQRGKMQGLFGAVWGFAGVIGPFLGALIISHASWRWVFLLNVPLGIIAAVLLQTSFRENVTRRAVRLDWLGALLLSCGVSAILLAASAAKGPIVVISVPIAAVLLTLFVFVESRVPEPIFPLTMLRMPVVAISSIVGALLSAAMFASITYVPLFVQGVLGGTPMQAGTVVTPMIIAWPFSSAISGRFMVRVGFRRLIYLGTFICALAMLILAIWGTTGRLALAAAMGTFGIGMGMANTALIIAVQMSVRWGQRGVATASSMFFRTVGGAIGVGVMGGVVVAGLAADSSIPRGAADALLGPAHGRGPDPAIIAVLSTALRGGLARVFWMIAIVVIVAFAFSFLFPRVVTIEEQA